MCLLVFWYLTIHGLSLQMVYVPSLLGRNMHFILQQLLSLLSCLICTLSPLQSQFLFGCAGLDQNDHKLIWLIFSEKNEIPHLVAIHWQFARKWVKWQGWAQDMVWWSFSRSDEGWENLWQVVGCRFRDGGENCWRRASWNEGCPLAGDAIQQMLNHATQYLLSVSQ